MAFPRGGSFIYFFFFSIGSLGYFTYFAFLLISFKFKYLSQKLLFFLSGRKISLAQGQNLEKEGLEPRTSDLESDTLSLGHRVPL